MPLVFQEVVLGTIAADWDLVPAEVFMTSNFIAVVASAETVSANRPPTATTLTVSPEPIPEAPRLNKSSAFKTAEAL